MDFEHLQEIRGVAAYYEIRVDGALPADALRDFGELNTAVQTVVSGPLDQAALHRLFGMLEMLGVDLLEVRRL
jgi:hypothetical protein